MSELVPNSRSDVATFDPKKTRAKLARLDGEIVEWRKLKDWPKLEEAVDAKLDEQADFVAEWDERVGKRQHENQYTLPAVVRAVAGGPLSLTEAEVVWGIIHQTVSRWRAWLKRRDIYRERLIRGSLRLAGLRDPAVSDYEDPVTPEGRFGTIIIDPPWKMSKIERDVRPNQSGFDYPTMTEAELAAFTVATDKAADDCHLFCWTTQKWLPTALRLVESWGFRYCLTMVWHKTGGFQPVRLPQYNCEFIVYARRGSPQFITTKDFPCCFEAPRREHGRKPDEFYDLIRRVTAEPRIDIFSREQRDGFAQFGNEIARFGT